MLDRIADGRTDLVFDYLSLGYFANSKDKHGRLFNPTLRILRGCQCHQIPPRQWRITGSARKQLWAQRRSLSWALETVPVPYREHRRRELCGSGYWRNA